MKNFFCVIILVASSIVATAQSRAIREFHDRFRDTGKYFTVHIEGGLLKFLSNVESDDQDTRAFLDAIRKIESIDLHAIDRREVNFDDKDVEQFRKSVSREKFDEMMKVRDGSSNIDFLIKENNGRISDLLMIVDDVNEFLLLNFSGDIDLAALARLSKDLDIKGAEHLDKIKDKRN